MGFNYGIPANKVNSVGTNQGCGVFDGDALLCDQNDCGTVCPGGPPAVSTQKFDQNVAAAFRPSTATPSDSYTNLADANGDFWGTVARRFDLPAASGTFNATCGQLRESDTLTIASSVVVTLLDNGPFSLHFQDPDFPGRFPPIPLILLPHSASGLQPIIILPPKAPQPPETTPGTEPGEPVIGGIIIRCPKRNRRCTGTLTAKARKNGPTLGTTKFSLPGGTDELTQVQPPRRHRRADRRPPQGPRRQEPGQDRHAQGAGQRRHPGPAPGKRFTSSRTATVTAGAQSGQCTCPDTCPRASRAPPPPAPPPPGCARRASA